MPHALIVDDDEGLQLGLVEIIGQEGFTTATARSIEEARAELGKNVPDVLLLDLSLPDGDGIDLLKEIRGQLSTEVVVITGHASIDSAVELIRAGASHYLTKPVDFARVKALLATIARTRELKDEIGELRGELRRLGRFGPLIGAAPAMQSVYDLIAKVAPTQASVLITGETGTGKELVAQTIHELSWRRKGPFLPLNCGAVSPTLIESELFGHEKGSFTGAEKQHRGLFEQAHKGTLFLDEITEMPLDLQVKLLRVLETHNFSRIGGQQPIESDVRVLAATNRSPTEGVADGKLREDLLYRLNVFPIHLPPLRERLEDVEMLAWHFLEEQNRQAGTLKELTRAAVQRLRSHTWPGNVRELKNLIQRAFLMAEGDIGGDHLSLGVEEPTGTNLNMRVGMPIAEAERRLILATLENCEGDKKKAAEVLGISLKTLYNRLNEYKAR